MNRSVKAQNIVFIESALIDLVPILLETLDKELAEMKELLIHGDLANLQEQIHSSRGAALTYGFESYSNVLIEAHKAVRAGDVEGSSVIFCQLQNMLETVVFKSSE